MHTSHVACDHPGRFGLNIVVPPLNHHLHPVLMSIIWPMQAAIARSAKWGTTDPPLRPVPLRQGSAPGPLDISPSGSAGPSPGKPPLAATEGFPKMSKLDALLMQQQQQQQQHSGSSSGEGKQTMSSPGALGAHASASGDQILHHASSAGQLGAIGTQVCRRLPFVCLSACGGALLLSSPLPPAIPARG